MTAIYVGSDHGPEADSDPLSCLAARADGYQATCGGSDHCPSCQLCADVHADDCPPRWVRGHLNLPPLPDPTPAARRRMDEEARRG